MGLMDFIVRDGKEKPNEKSPAPLKVTPSSSGDVDIIDALLHNKEVVTQIETPYGDFEFKYPSGSDSLKISHRRAAYLGGFPDQSFDNSRRAQFEKWATLDILVTKKPERFEGVDSWADCPDQELVDILFERGARFCGGIRQKIGDARPGKLIIPDKPGDA